MKSIRTSCTVYDDAARAENARAHRIRDAAVAGECCTSCWYGSRPPVWASPADRIVFRHRRSIFPDSGASCHCWMIMHCRHFVGAGTPFPATKEPPSSRIGGSGSTALGRGLGLCATASATRLLCRLLGPFKMWPLRRGKIQSPVSTRRRRSEFRSSVPPVPGSGE